MAHMNPSQMVGSSSINARIPYGQKAIYDLPKVEIYVYGDRIVVKCKTQKICTHQFSNLGGMGYSFELDGQWYERREEDGAWIEIIGPDEIRISIEKASQILRGQ